MAVGNGNGNTITTRTWLPISLVITIIIAVAGAAAWAARVEAQANASKAAIAQLQAASQEYVTCKELQTQIGPLAQRLDRMEAKIDQLIERQMEVSQ